MDDITRAIVAGERFADALRHVYDAKTLRHIDVTSAFQNRLRKYAIPLVLIRGEPIDEVKNNED
jgi:hypothetical protein